MRAPFAAAQCKLGDLQVRGDVHATDARIDADALEPRLARGGHRHAHDGDHRAGGERLAVGITGRRLPPTTPTSITPSGASSQRGHARGM